MVTKKKAIEIALLAHPEHHAGTCGDWERDVRGVVDALAAEHAFPDEATLAEIAEVAGGILEYDAWLESTGRLAGRSDFHNRALRLASACRKAGLVK